MTRTSEPPHECPDSEVRIILRHPHLRTAESKDTSNLLISCGFGSEVRITNSRRELCGLTATLVIRIGYGELLRWTPKAPFVIRTIGSNERKKRERKQSPFPVGT